MDYSEFVILNFDLGIRGDYDNLYIFLDKNNAIDCGNSNCVFQYKFSGSDLNYDDKFNQILDSINKVVTFSKNDRIYVIVHNEEGNPKGKFIIGQRKTPVWDGYAIKEDDDNLPF